MNALVPEWIIQIFMAKYRFTREEAIERLQAQEAYSSHIASKNPNYSTSF